MVTSQRAKEIIAAAKAAVVIGPWVDRLDHYMTEAERKEVLAVWETLPGHYGFVHALSHIAEGKC